jgi:hypothetical protein
VILAKIGFVHLLVEQHIVEMYGAGVKMIHADIYK